jgi:starch-binding outer membrane protein, SusD/RagB family
MNNKKIIYVIVAIVALTISSCSNYLDVSDEMTQNLSMEDVFNSPTYTKSWYANIYNCISEYSETGSDCNAFKNPWSNLCGEISSQISPYKDVETSGYTAGDAQLQRWGSLYQYIRQAMIFIKYGKAVGSTTDESVITEDEINRMKDDARFLIAYCYVSLFEQYGPAPIITELENAEEPSKRDYARPSVDQYVSYVDSLLNGVITRNNIPNTVTDLNEMVRPTKVAAMALRAKLWMFAASPLFNGGYEEAMKLKNNDGTQIFPAYNAQKWATAKKYVKALIDYAEANGHSLYTVANDAGTEDVNQTLYKLFQCYNCETLWATTNNSYSSQWLMEPRTTPRDIYNSYGTIGPSQESVDNFFMSNGLSISDNGSGYKENGLVSVTNVCNENKRVDANVFNMYANREPRFYADVIYQGKSWHIQPTSNPNYYVDFSAKGGVGPSSSDTPMVGYLLGKFKNRKILNTNGYITSYYRPWTLFRLADFYLYYAEACNEVDPSDPDIITYLDKVRTRAGVPGYNDLVSSGKKNIIGNQVEQRKAIQQERFVELFCEGQRYFDIRRWMICGSGQDADQTLFTGMNEYGDPNKTIGSADSYYTRTVIEKRIWRKAMYLYPIPQDEINLCKKLVQNPGW